MAPVPEAPFLPEQSEVSVWSRSMTRAALEHVQRDMLGFGHLTARTAKQVGMGGKGGVWLLEGPDGYGGGSQGRETGDLWGEGGI